MPAPDNADLWRTFLVETDDGILFQRVGPASPLPEGPEGPGAEDATRMAAARWGLPDFVFKSLPFRKGSGVREVGDAILVARELASSIQVKARTEYSGKPERERAWLDKNIAKGASQAHGTIRRMRSIGTLTLTNERGRSVAVQGVDKEWVPVVVLDHPGLPEYELSQQPGVVVLLRRSGTFCSRS
jgi:hypothetical protein